MNARRTLLALLTTAGLWTSVHAGTVTEITLGDFDAPDVLDFNSAPVGAISATASLFTDFGITEVVSSGSVFDDPFDSRPNASRALWFSSSGLSIAEPGAPTNYARGVDFDIRFASSQTRIGVGVHDQTTTNMIFTFYDGLADVGSIQVLNTSPDLVMYYLSNTDSFDRVTVESAAFNGFAIDNITLDTTAVPIPASVVLFASSGIALLSLGRRRRKA